MELINTIIGPPLGWIMWLCYRLSGSYVCSIILLTLISKILFLPLSIAVQKNSIKMIRIQPKINRITLRHFGDRDTIADKTMELYKKENYSPTLGIIPMLVQIILVLGMIGVVYNPMQHLLHFTPEISESLVHAALELSGETHFGAAAQLQALAVLQNPAYTQAFLNLSLPNGATLLDTANQLNMSLGAMDLGAVPRLLQLGLLTLIPLGSCLSSFLLCWAQNRANVLQREQKGLMRWSVTLFTVALSTYFTYLVPAAVGLYWIVSNLMGLFLLYLMNWIYPPEKEIDYEALHETQNLLDARKQTQKETLKKLKPYEKREKQDYRRFFRWKEPKQFVIYSESNGFYKYYAGMIDYILKNSSIVIHYITSDPHDNVFTMESDRFHAYYIGELRLIPLMMKIDADIVLMTVPDLELFHLKRSLVRKDIEYIYMEHGIGSDNLLGRPHSLDHYDTIFNAGPHHTQEDRALEALYGLPPRRLVKVGYGLIDEMTEAWGKAPKKSPQEKKTILIAPSWQADNIMDSCVDQLIGQFLPLDVKLIVRPHPQYVRLYPDRIAALKHRWESSLGPDFEIQTDFSSTDTVYNADLLITDWSNVAFEFSFSTKKPSLFINTPMKVMNPDYKLIDVEPIDIWIRSQLGGQLDLDELDRAGETATELLANQEVWRTAIEDVKKKAIYNIGHGSEAAGRYIIARLERKE